jgi:LPS-assembly protein
MKRLFARVCCLLLLCAGAVLGAEEEPVPLVVEPQGEGEFDFNPRTGVASATNGVIVRYGLATLKAQQVTLNQLTGEVLAEGKVHIENEGQIWNGDRIAYNFKTRQLSTAEFRTGQLPFFVQGPGLEVNLTNRFYSLTNGMVTTDDYAEPLYRIRAQSITVVPGKYIEARRATLWLGKVPIWYMPVTRRSLVSHPNFWTFTPGYRTVFGPYLLSEYHRVWSDEFETALNLDYRWKRGPGVGPDATWNSPTLGEGQARYYYTHDDGTELDPNTLRPIPENRQRVWFSERLTLRTNLTVKAMVRWQSDPYVVRDFYETEYREDIQPNTFIEANQDWRNWNLNLEVQPRVNDFQETVERLPDVTLTGLRQELGESPFFYESVSSVGYYRRLWPTAPPTVVLPPPYEAARADTYQKMLVPLNLFGWLNIAPRVGQRFTYYSAASGPGVASDDISRAVFDTGMEVSFKASRLWREAHSSLLDVKGLRHIIEPSVNYAYVPDPSTPPQELPQFDYRVPTYWPLPIHFPAYNDIDFIDSQNVMRLGLGNRLQTKRENGVEDLLDWHLLTDWRVTTHPGQTTFSPLYSMLDFRPRSWFTLSSLARTDLYGGPTRGLDHTLIFYPSSTLNLAVGHRYRHEEEFGPTDVGDNLILGSVAYRLNENYAVRATYQYDIHFGLMEEQSYTLWRDMRSWTAAVVFRYRQNLGKGDDLTFALTFSLKAFPRYALGKDTDRPTLLLGN